MARGVNKVILIGNLGNDPETKTFDNGGSITNISIATSESWTDKQTGQKQERTEWHRVVFNNRLAEIAAQYLRKGSKVYVEGSLRTRKWQDQNGQDRYATEIRADQMQMLDSRGDNAGGFQQNAPMNQSMNQPMGHQGGQPMGQQGGYGNQGGGFNAPAQNAPKAPSPQPSPQYSDDFDDDIPF